MHAVDVKNIHKTKNKGTYLWASEQSVRKLPFLFLVSCVSQFDDEKVRLNAVTWINMWMKQKQIKYMRNIIGNLVSLCVIFFRLLMNCRTQIIAFFAHEYLTSTDRIGIFQNSDITLSELSVKNVQEK